MKKKIIATVISFILLFTMMPISAFAAADTIQLVFGDSYGDGWNGAGIEIYEEGILIDTITMDSGSEKTIDFDFDDTKFYKMIWYSGEFDTECSLEIYHQDLTNPVYYLDSLYKASDGDVIYTFGNVADYSGVNQALASIPDLSGYSDDSVLAVVKAVNAVDIGYGASQQSKVDDMAAAITKAVNQLVPISNAKGRLDVSNGDIYITSTGYRRGENAAETSYTGDYTIMGTTDEYSVIVESGTHNIKLLNVKIENSDDADIDWNDPYAQGQRAPFEIEPGATVNLTLVGDNILTAYRFESAGLGVEKGATLHILDSEGSITVNGEYNAAGIGSHAYQDAGTIIIDGGTINAFSADDGAGIGGGYQGDAGTIIINGGTIFAQCLRNDGPGIGAGDDGTGGSITINGGTITALSLEDDGAGIGSGDEGYVDEITINGGYITVGSDDSAAIGSNEGRCGKIIINGGVIIISDKHGDDVIIGTADSYEVVNDENNFIQINGANIISDEFSEIDPSPKNAAGQPLVRFNLTVPDELADKRVLVTSGDYQLVVTAVGTKVTVYMPEDFGNNQVQFALGDADYTAVDKAIDSIPKDLSIYTDDSVAQLTNAVNAVVRNLDITKQAEVDAMADAIAKAVAALQLKPIDNQDNQDNINNNDNVNNNDTSNLEDSSLKSPDTGSQAFAGVAFVMLAAGVAVLSTLKIAKKAKK